MFSNLKYTETKKLFPNLNFHKKLKTANEVFSILKTQRKQVHVNEVQASNLG